LEKIPASPPIFKRLMWINYIACAAIIAYGAITLDAAIITIGVAGEVVFAVLNKLGAA